MNLDRVDFVLLSEINILEDDVNEINFRQYQLFSNCRSDRRGGGVGILVNKRYQAELIKMKNFSPIEIIGVSVKIKKAIFSFFSIYIPPNSTLVSSSIVKSKLNSIFSKLNKIKNLVLGGDFNAHNKMWNSCKNDTFGGIVSQIITESDLVLLNYGNEHSTISRPDARSSVIDLTLASADISNNLDWFISNDNFGSDHRCINVSMNINSSFQKNEKTINRLDIDLYSTEMLNINIDFCTNLDEFLFVHNNVIAKCSTEKKIDLERLIYCKKWFNNEIKTLYENKRSALRQNNKNCTLQSYLELRKCEALLYSNIRKAKKESWFDFVGTINPSSTLQNIFESYQKLLDKHKFITLNILENDETLANEYLVRNFSDSKNEDKITFEEQNFEHILNNNFGFLEMENILKFKSGNSTAPGYDLTTYKMIFSWPIDVKKFLLDQINLIWNGAAIPEEWKQINLKTCLKPGKPIEDIDSYRPLALISCMSKLMMHMVKNRLVDYIEENNFYPQNSFGFRKNKSCMDCVNILITKISKYRKVYDFVAVVFLDLNKAFDNIDKQKLIKTLYDFKTPQKIINYLGDYLKCRKIRIKTNTGISEIETSKGIGQGCPGSPDLFNCYTICLHYILDPQYFEVFQYADDFAILIRANNNVQLNDSLNLNIDSFIKALHNLNFGVNTSKTKLVVFKQNKRNPINLYINDSPIEEIVFYKYLGIWIDNKLKFNKNLDELKIAINKRINVLKMISNFKFGANPESLLVLFKSIILSRIDYNAIALPSTKTGFENIEVLQLKALRIVCGFLKSTPRHVIWSETCVLPVKYRIQYILGKRSIKRIAIGTESLEEMQTENFHYSRNKKDFFKIIKKVEILPIIDSLSRKEILSRITCNSNTISKIDKKENNCVEKMRLLGIETVESILFNGFSRIYTDAAKNQNGSGIGVFFEEFQNTLLERVDDNFCIMNAELFAMHKAILFCVQNDIERAVIFSDSKSGILALENSFEISKLNNQIENIFKTLSTASIELIFQWIPSHVGIRGNEKADKAAVNASFIPIQELNQNLSIEETILLLKKDISTKWKMEYEEICKIKGKSYAQIEGSPRTAPWFKNYKGSPHEIRTLTRIRTGHYISNIKLKLFGFAEDENCEICFVKEDINHILFNCRKYSNIRKNFKILNEISDVVPFLQTMEKEFCKQIYKFLQMAQIKI